MLCPVARMKRSPQTSRPPAPRLQAAFFRRMGLGQQFRGLFEHLPDVHFFVKDLDGRFVAVGADLLQRLGFSREEEIIGLTDADIHPARVAREIRADDRRVMQTREPLIDRVEALFTRSQAKDWYVTTKLPVIGTRGEVIGVMGFVRPYRRGGIAVPGAERLEPTVAYIGAHHAQPIVVAELARIAHTSTRQLVRLFQSVFGMSPQEFVIRTRVQAASDDLIRTESALADIAHAHGFYDQSAFSRQFSQHTGETPQKFRQRHRHSGLPHREK